jgi:hypothetical protein
MVVVIVRQKHGVWVPDGRRTDRRRIQTARANTPDGRRVGVKKRIDE